MAFIYKRPPFYKGEKKWDNNDTLSKVYKLRSSNPKNKNLVKIHKDNGGYSIEFTINKMIPEFNQGAEKCKLTWVDSFTEFKKCAPRTARDCLEADAPQALPRACRCDKASPERSRLQLG